MNGQTSLRKTWEVLFPYLLYYLAYNAAYLILTFAYQATVGSFGGAYRQFMTAHAATVTGVMGGMCMLAGILPLMPMLKNELYEKGETAYFVMPKTAGTADQAGSLSAPADRKQWNRASAAADDTELLTISVKQERFRRGRLAALTVALAFSVSLGLNALLTLSGFADSSQTYQEVADRQYSVAFAAGVVVYGLISPLAEEVVFRGVIYNRMRRLYTPAVGIVASGLLFGAFHGNLVQGVYGGCLGMLMAYLYEKGGRLWIPFLFHAVANLAVYITARLTGVQEILFTPAGCAVLLAVSAVCVWAERRFERA